MQHFPESHLTVYGFHGTLVQNAEQIVRTNFEIRPKPWDWLGAGVYFWQDAPLRAIEWGREWYRKKHQIEEPKVAVIRATLHLKDCLDLLDTRWNEFLRRTRDRLAQAYQDTRLENQPRGRNELDYAFFNYVVALMRDRRVSIKCIRAAFGEGEALYPGSPVRLKSHVQIAVRSTTLITHPVIVYAD